MKKRDGTALLSLVIPLYREGSHFAESLKEIMRILGGVAMRYELVLIDDGSPDDTWEIIEAQCAQFSQI